MAKKDQYTWEYRWIKASIIQSGIIASITFFLIISHLGFLKPEPSRVIASGGAGTWLIVGLLSYIIFGGIATAVTAIFYHIIGTKIGKLENKLSWVHIIFSNIGIFLAFTLMIYGGYKGGAAMLPTQVGGLGWNAQQVHEAILGPLVLPILIGLLLLWIGFVAGGLAIVLAMKRS